MTGNDPHDISVRLVLPDVRAMSDEEIARRLPQLDGRWSEQTKRLVRSFRAEGLDLNANWADKPVDWQCKCCARAKPAIVRKSETGVLLAHLQLHHDHLRDHLRIMLNQRFGIPWMDAVPLPSRAAADHVEALVERFRETIICDACNAAEGAAKAALRNEVHGQFSYAPSEISRFIRPRPNVLHDIDMEVALRVWREVKAGFDDRLAFAGSLVERLATGLLAVERGPDSVRAYGRMPADLILGAPRGRDQDLSAYLAWRGRVGIDLLDRSVARDGVGNSGRVKKKRRDGQGRSPTDAEMAAFEDHAQSGWKKTSHDWSCPACGRNKRGIMRIGKSGRWFGQIRIHYDAMPETDVKNLSYRAALYPHHQVSPIVGSRRQTFVCSDCGDVASDLQRSRPDLGQPTIALDDIRDCLGAIRDNEKTVIDLDVAAAKSTANFGLMKAEMEFAEHADLATGLWTFFEMLGKDKSLRPMLIAQALKAGVDVERTDGAIRWLLRQGRRFVEDQRANDATN